jgi:hypothetical protein
MQVAAAKRLGDIGESDNQKDAKIRLAQYQVRLPAPPPPDARAPFLDTAWFTATLQAFHSLSQTRAAQVRATAVESLQL